MNGHIVQNGSQRRGRLAVRQPARPAPAPPPRTLRTEKQLTAPADRRVRSPAHAVAFTTAAAAAAIGGAGPFESPSQRGERRHLLRRPVAAARRGVRLALACFRRLRRRARAGLTRAAPPEAAPILVRRPFRPHRPVRLSRSAHHRRTSFPYVLGVRDRAGSRDASRYWRPGRDLPPSPTAAVPQGCRMILKEPHARAA